MFAVATNSNMMNNDMDLSYFSQGPFLQLYGIQNLVVLNSGRKICASVTSRVKTRYSDMLTSKTKHLQQSPNL